MPLTRRNKLFVHPCQVIHPNISHVVMCDCGDWFCLLHEKHLKDCGCDKRQEKLNKMFPYKNRKG